MRADLQISFLMILAVAASSNATSTKTIKKRLKKIQGCSGNNNCQFDISDLRGGVLMDIEDIEIELGHGITRTFKQTRPSRSDMFHGESGLASMDVVTRELETRGPGPNTTLYFGSISDENNVYQFGPDEFGITRVTVTPWADVPPETDPVVPPKEGMVPNRKLKNVKRKLSKVVKSKPRFDFDENGNRRKLVSDNGETIDVMVVWTRDAECARISKPVDCRINQATTEGMIGLIELAIEETNIAYTESGIHTQLRLVHAYRDETYVEPTTKYRQATTALADITYSDDGKMDDVHEKRDEYGADLVALIVAGRSDGGICGTAWVGPSDSFMFSVTNWKCSTGVFSFGHEIGHNMGCQHDRGQSENCVDKNKYNFGWRDPKARFRTILAYHCITDQCDNNKGGGCPRIQRFSTPLRKFKYDGVNSAPLGDEYNDCARRINDVVAKVASFRTAVECEKNSDCNDNDSCTVDTCNSFTGQCSHSNTCVNTEAPKPTPPPQPTLPPPIAIETLFTTDAAGNGQSGNMFDIDVKEDVEIVGFDIHTRLTSDVDVVIFTRPGHYVTNDNDGLWTIVQIATVKGKGEFELTKLPHLSNPVKVSEGATQAFYITLPVDSNDLRYTDAEKGSEGKRFVSDGTVSLKIGRGVEYPFLTTYPDRIWNGKLKYKIGTGIPAGPTPPVNTLLPTLLPTPPTTSTPVQSGAMATLFTTDAAGNGQAGCMFELTVATDVDIVGFDILIRLTSNVVVTVWTRSGKYVKNNADGLWTIVQSVPVIGKGEDELTELPKFFKPVRIKSGRKQAFYVSLPVKTPELRYSDQTSGIKEGDVFVSDGIVSVLVGRGVEYKFGRSYPGRVFNGNIKYKAGVEDPFASTAPPSIISGLSPSSQPSSPQTATPNQSPTNVPTSDAQMCVRQLAWHASFGLIVFLCMYLL